MTGELLFVAAYGNFLADYKSIAFMLSVGFQAEMTGLCLMRFSSGVSVCMQGGPLADLRGHTMRRASSGHIPKWRYSIALPTQCIAPVAVISLRGAI